MIKEKSNDKQAGLNPPTHAELLAADRRKTITVSENQAGPTNALLYMILSGKSVPDKLDKARCQLRQIFETENSVNDAPAWNFDTGVAYLLSRREMEGFDHELLRKLDARAWNMVNNRHFRIETFVDICRYLLIRYTCTHTTERDRLNVKSTMIHNLFMLQSCFVNRNVRFWKAYIKPAELRLCAGELAEFAPGHNLLVVLNMLKHYYKLNLFGKKAADIFRLIIEAIEPSFERFAPANQLYIASVIRELKQCRTWAKDHIPTEIILAQVHPDELKEFDTVFESQLYISGGKPYMATREKFFLPII